MYHWDLPQYLQDLGGWVNPIMSDYFLDYAQVLFTQYGDRVSQLINIYKYMMNFVLILYTMQVKWWITFNEPMETCKGYAFNMYAPYLHLNSTGYYLAAHTQLIAHGKVYRLYEKIFKSKQQGSIEQKILRQKLKTFV